MFSLFRRFLSPYRWCVVANILLNLITAIFNLFSFASIIPILQILFGMDSNAHSHIPFSQITSLESFLDIAKNNIYAYIESLINQHGASTALMLLGIYLIVMTLLKTLSAFLASCLSALAYCATFATPSTTKSHRSISATSPTRKRATSSAV